MANWKRYLPWVLIVVAGVYLANPGGCGRVVETAHMRDVTEADFAAVVEAADGWVLVDFWAPWCGPCRAMLPVLDDLAAAYAGRVLFVKVNIDENPGLAERFGVESIPHVHLFRDGGSVTGFVGYRGSRAIRQWLDESIEPSAGEEMT